MRRLSAVEISIFAIMLLTSIYVNIEESSADWLGSYENKQTPNQLFLKAQGVYGRVAAARISQTALKDWWQRLEAEQRVLWGKAGELDRDFGALKLRTDETRERIEEYSRRCGGVITDQTVYDKCVTDRQILTAESEDRETEFAALQQEENVYLERGRKWEGELQMFIVECETALFTPAATELVSHLNNAAQTINPNKETDPEKQSLKCSEFFRAVGSEFAASGDAWAPGLQANQIIDKIVSDKSGQWAKVDEKDVQTFANRGIVVVGVRKDTRPGHHGHLAVASPCPQDIDLSDFGRYGPMIRDGNVYEKPETGKIYPKDWGTVRATFAFGNYRENPPAWYMWVPSEN